ncbi:MAG: hypothetical protein Q4F75_08840, partial [Pseudomonadota bacterium]|nr:hypothetical protein [Pseudomonadota bacterium]
KIMEATKFQGLTVEAMYGDCVTDTIKRMIALSKKKNQPVQTTFNGATFSVTAETTPEEAYALWEKTMNDNYEAYRNSPEGIKAAAEQKAREEKKIKDDAEVDELVKDEVLELTAPKCWEHSVEINKDAYGASVIRYAERWGKLMQVEMKNRKTEILTKEIQDATQFKADNEGMSGFSWSCGRNILIQCWKYGDQLGKLEGFTDDKIKEARDKAETMGQ